ncbi:TIR-like protein FxsC [Streptomyces sp. NPDC002276]
MEPLGAESAAPYFFLSYAHSPRDDFDEPDPDMWVHRFFRDLRGHIREMADTDGGPAGFMDRSMRAGEIWTEELEGSLAGCRVFVPLYSPRYFRSSWCGREWTAFGRRAAHRRTGERTTTPSAVVPALWTPVPTHRLPDSVKDLQYTHPELGDRYREYGLYGLIKVSSFRGAYQKAVMELAQRIVKVGEDVIVERGGDTPLRQLPNAFEPLDTRRTLRITVAAHSVDRVPDGRAHTYYGRSPLHWNPYHPESAKPLASVAAEIAERLDYRPDVRAFDPGTTAEAGPPDGPEVMLLDRWTLRDPEHRAGLAEFDRSHRPATALVVPWNRDDPDSEAAEDELSAAAEAVLPQKMNQGRQACRPAVRGIPDHESCGVLLPHVVQWAAVQYLKQNPGPSLPGPTVPRFRLSISGDQDGRRRGPRPYAEEDDDEQP